MRKIFRIAKLELSTLFYSPVAWIILVIFIFQAGLDFTDKMTVWDTNRLLGQRHFYGLTGYIFLNDGVIYTILTKLYLYIPLLTMGLMSRETSSGSIKLLLSSPVKMREIIIGKYLAMMAYGLILITIMAMIVFAADISIKSADIGLLIAGLTAIYLVICAYSAIGLFMSSLTSYQVVAAISTLAVLAALNYIGLVGQNIGFVRDITYFLSIAGRAGVMTDGLLTSKDVLYFVIVVVIFLGLSVLKLQSARESKPLAVKIGRYVLFISVMLFIGYISSRPKLIAYYDMTADKSQTLTPVSQKIIKQLKGPLTFTTYSNLFDDISPWAFPKDQNKDFSHFLPYQRFMPDMDVRYVYYYDTCEMYRTNHQKLNPGLSMEALAKKVADSYKVNLDIFLTPAQIRKQVDLSGEHNHLVRQLQVGNKKAWLRMYNDMFQYPSETEITSALKRLEVTPTKVAVLTGHNERSINSDGDKHFKTPTVGEGYRASLINQGLDVENISIKDKDIPADVSILLIVDPRDAFDNNETTRIKAFIDRGGNMLIAGEPGKQDVLNPVIKRLGLRYIPGKIVQTTADAAPDYVLASVPDGTSSLSNNFLDIQKNHGSYGKVTMPGVMAIDPVGGSSFQLIPLLTVKDSANCWSTLKEIKADSVLKFSPGTGDVQKSFTTAYGLTRHIAGKEQRIVVVGDADFMSNGELARRGGVNFERLNYYFDNAIIGWLGNDEFPVDVTRPDKKDDGFIMSSSAIATMKPIFLGVIPALIIIWGALLLIIRKRK